MADIKNQYKEFTNKTESLYTVNKAKTDKKRIEKEKSQNNFEEVKKDAFSNLNEWGNTANGIDNDFKKQMQAFKENQLDSLTKLFLITDSKAINQDFTSLSNANSTP